MNASQYAYCWAGCVDATGFVCLIAAVCVGAELLCVWELSCCVCGCLVLCAVDWKRR